MPLAIKMINLLRSVLRQNSLLKKILDFMYTSTHVLPNWVSKIQEPRQVHIRLFSQTIIFNWLIILQRPTPISTSCKQSNQRYQKSKMFNVPSSNELSLFPTVCKKKCNWENSFQATTYIEKCSWKTCLQMNKRKAEFKHYFV